MSNWASKNERIVFITISGILLGVIVSVMTYDLVSAYDRSVLEKQLEFRRKADQQPRISLSRTSPTLTVGGLHLLAIPLFLTILFGRRYIAALAVGLIYLAIYLYSFIPRYWNGGLGSRELYESPSYLRMIWIEAQQIEYCVLALLLVLIGWLCWILARNRHRLRTGLTLS